VPRHHHGVHLALELLVLAFGSASYVVGARDVLVRGYAPSVFSRVVWLLLAGISSAGVVASGSGSGAVLLAGVFLVGNAVMCLLSLWKGTREVGRLEHVCLAILAVSVLVWLVFDAPVVSLVLSLLAHLVGGVPTYRRAWRRPASESAGFWSLFFVASVFSLLATLGEPAQSLVFPLYFVLFDGGMTALALRRQR
jgi:hypothetical protein